MRILDVVPAFKRYALFERGITPKTIKEIISIVSLLSTETSKKSLKYLKTSDIRDFLYKKKTERMWSNKTFRNKRQYLKSFFDYCLREGYIRTNPVEKIEKPKLSKRLPRCLSRQQINTLLLYLDSYEWYNVLERKRNQALIVYFGQVVPPISELLCHFKNSK